MTDIPSDGSRRIVKKLERMGTIFATKPSAREALAALDYEADVYALGECITDGVDDTGGGLAKDEKRRSYADARTYRRRKHWR